MPPVKPENTLIPSTQLGKKKTVHRKVRKGVTPHPGVKRILNPDNMVPGVGGAPELHIDEGMLYAAAETLASFEHLGDIFGCAGKTLSETPKFRTVIDKARAESKKTLLAAQFRNAVTLMNPTMQIWLGKQHLGQKDVMRTEHSGPNGRPIQSQSLKMVVAYFPENHRRRPIDDDRTGTTG